jgi:hypothetical protein
MIALEASAAGNCIVNVPLVEVLSAPKSSTATVGSPEAVSLYSNAPRAVIVADVNERSAKSVNAVVPEDVGVTFVSAPPPALYEPESLTSLLEVYAVVAALNDALLVYRASLNVLPEEVVKLWVPVSSSFLNDVHM